MSGVEAAIGFGASVLGIASAGISAASTLMRFSASYKSSAEKIEDLSSRVSLTATILTTVGNTIESHKDYFKEDDFRGKFGRVTQRCKKDYGILGQALSKARSEVEDLASERERKVKKMTPWRKLIWALGGEERMQDLQSSLEESKSQVLMMQSAASLILLQIIGRSTLTEDETNDLAELKLKMGLLLVALQDAKLLPPVPTKKPERIVRPDSASSRGKFITDERFDAGVAKETAKEIPVPPRTISRPTVEEEESMREHREPECAVVEHSPEQKETKSRPRPSSLLLDGRVVDKEKPADVVSSRDFYYEAWAVYAKSPPKMRTIRFLGLSIKIKDNNSTDFDSYSGLAATQNEILDLLAQLNPAFRSSSKLSSTLQQLVALTPPTARTVTHLISGRTEATKGYPGPRTWAIELLMPWSSIKSASEKSLLGSTLGRQTIKLREVGYGYLLILRSPEPEYGTQAIDGDKLMEPSRDDNPFRNDWPILEPEHRRLAGPPPGVEFERERGPIIIHEAPRWAMGHDRLPSRSRPSPSAPPSPSRRFPPPPIHPKVITHHRHIDHGYGGYRRADTWVAGLEDEEDKMQAQKDAETAVNDFLASFSTLYDGVPPEERTKVLDSVAVPEQGDESSSESDENNSTRTSLRSYGDV